MAQVSAPTATKYCFIPLAGEGILDFCLRPMFSFPFQCLFVPLSFLLLIFFLLLCKSAFPKSWICGDGQTCKAGCTSGLTNQKGKIQLGNKRNVCLGSSFSFPVQGKSDM